MYVYTLFLLHIVPSSLCPDEVYTVNCVGCCNHIATQYAAWLAISVCSASLLKELCPDEVYTVNCVGSSDVVII